MGPDVKDLCEIGNSAGVEATESYANLSKPQTSLTSLNRDVQNSAAVSLTTLGLSRGQPPLSNTQQRPKLIRKGNHNLATTQKRLPTKRKSWEPFQTVQV